MVPEVEVETAVGCAVVEMLTGTRIKGVEERV